MEEDYGCKMGWYDSLKKLLDEEGLLTPITKVYQKIQKILAKMPEERKRGLSEIIESYSTGTEKMLGLVRLESGGKSRDGE